MKYFTEKFTNVGNYVDFRYNKNWYYRDSVGNIILITQVTTHGMRFCDKTKISLQPETSIGLVKTAQP